ncbi:hypothetical protein ARMGADRAFT_50770 [Armillaria gallica]|uniref:Uncharacterized protein n=1 Tax=Armillaria gallica TaxID=47427 RepID=A0A2H3EAB7_ARMGA|nr:hypothetical protein ARMGADRAFT_50770 [Armillaria gallica]
MCRYICDDEVQTLCERINAFDIAAETVPSVSLSFHIPKVLKFVWSWKDLATWSGSLLKRDSPPCLPHSRLESRNPRANRSWSGARRRTHILSSTSTFWSTHNIGGTKLKATGKPRFHFSTYLSDLPIFGCINIGMLSHRPESFPCLPCTQASVCESLTSEYLPPLPYSVVSCPRH